MKRVRRSLVGAGTTIAAEHMADAARAREGCDVNRVVSGCAPLAAGRAATSGASATTDLRRALADAGCVCISFPEA
ncbi:MAG: hypothetical protein GDA53_10060 [Rhodobacteraceae bacterium]|nr:hypothetical protein [Paracoccaceae bacterium]